jgi:hypothetical protein
LQVTTIEGFVSNLVQTFEGTAHDAAQKILFDQHADAERMKFREIKSSSGKKKEIDGGSMSKNCAVIVEAKTKLTAAHVAELCEKRDFILCALALCLVAMVHSFHCTHMYRSSCPYIWI